VISPIGTGLEGSGKETAMAESLSKVLDRFRFEGGPVETLYLDEIRVHEDFIGQVGAIASFTRLATREGSGGLETPVLKIDAGASSEDSVTWNLGHPIVQVLVLRALLQAPDSRHDLRDAEPGGYVIFSGNGIISRPGMFDDLHRERLKEHPGLYEKLEAERAIQQRDIQETDGPRESLWLLTISNGDSICAATLMGGLLRPPFRHWIRADSPWEIIGLCRHIHKETGVPWLAPLYLCAKFGLPHR
jgi:hypothetical protein